MANVGDEDFWCEMVKILLQKCESTDLKVDGDLQTFTNFLQMLRNQHDRHSLPQIDELRDFITNCNVAELVQSSHTHSKFKSMLATLTHSLAHLGIAE